MRSSKPLVAVVAVAASVLAACGGEETVSPSGTVGGNGAEGQAIDHDRGGPAAPVDGAASGGAVTVFGPYSVETLDPTEAYLGGSISILSGLVTRSLTQYVYDPEQDAMVLVPDIATDTGTPNADFTEWTFTIRDGVRFEDGTEVTAEDVAYGIKRSFDRHAFRYGPFYSNAFFLDGDSYKGPYRSGTSYPGVVVEGDRLTIKMDRPFPDMPYWGAFPAMGPIPERGSDPATYALHPLATGPYKIADYTPGKSLTLVRNEEWDPDTDPGRHAYPDRYIFNFSEQDPRIRATILGDSEQGKSTLSFDTPSHPIPERVYRRAQALDRMTVGSTACAILWFPDYRTITDIRVRQAIGYATPYREDAEYFGLIPGITWLFGTSALPPGFPERQDYRVLDIEPGRTDPDQAKVLLKKAGYAPGEYELSWAYIDDDPLWKGENDLVVQSFEAAGFKTRPFPTSTDDYGTVNNDPDAPINLRFVDWCADWPTGNAWIPQLFQSRPENLGVSGESQGIVNLGYFAEPVVDAEIERISLLPIDEQPAAWAALDKTIMTDYFPAIIAGYPTVAILHGSNIGGLNTDVIWKDIYIVQ